MRYTTYIRLHRLHQIQTSVIQNELKLNGSVQYKLCEWILHVSTTVQRFATSSRLERTGIGETSGPALVEAFVFARLDHCPCFYRSCIFINTIIIVS